MTQIDPNAIITIFDDLAKAANNKTNPTPNPAQPKPVNTTQVNKQFKVDQIWSFDSQEGEEWLFIRLGQSPAIQSIRSPTPKESKLLVSGNLTVTITE